MRLLTVLLALLVLGGCCGGYRVDWRDGIIEPVDRGLHDIQLRRAERAKAAAAAKAEQAK